MNLKKAMSIYNCSLHLTTLYKDICVIASTQMTWKLFFLHSIHFQSIFHFYITKNKQFFKYDYCLNGYLSISLLLHCVVDFIYFLCKHIKLRDDKFLSEGLDQQDDISTNTPESRIT